jgi:hypothetical protein
MGFELATLVVIGTDCIGSYKSNYQTITSTTAPIVYNYLTMTAPIAGLTTLAKNRET